MKTKEPWFMEWVKVDFNGWSLKENAPKDVKKAFKDYIEKENLCIIEVDLENEE